ncbi:ATP-binding cassette domain-containing protein [Candidatus Poribacteria bacterium]|nr:ATP-binding cassette domain-containing protein [Candidatus Poribacteria bacterium]
MITTTELTKNYGDLIAVDKLNLHVEPGELFVFLGPNGAGKTTTIKMLTGLLHPTSGKAAVAGMDIVENPLGVKRIMGYLPENPFLYDKLTGREFLEFVADVHGVDKKRDKIGRFMELFELINSRDEMIEGYSLGMRKKIAIGAALIHDPKVVFLDEPTGGLDPKSARIMKDLLQSIRSRGTTVFMTTHILEVAEKMCDRVGIINNGSLIAVGTVSELRGEDIETSSLEDIFLNLTGGTQQEQISLFLDNVTDDS